MKYVVISSNWFDTKIITTDNPKETLIKYYIHYHRNVMNSWINNNSAKIVTNDGNVIKMKIFNHYTTV